MKLVLTILLTSVILAGCARHPSQKSRGANADSNHVVADVISNNKITAFAEDAQGHIWIGTDRGLNKYNINEYHQYFSDSTA